MFPGFPNVKENLMGISGKKSLKYKGFFGRTYLRK